MVMFGSFQKPVQLGLIVWKATSVKLVLLKPTRIRMMEADVYLVRKEQPQEDSLELSNVAVS